MEAKDIKPRKHDQGHTARRQGQRMMVEEQAIIFLEIQIVFRYQRTTSPMINMFENSAHFFVEDDTVHRLSLGDVVRSTSPRFSWDGNNIVWNAENVMCQNVLAPQCDTITYRYLQVFAYFAADVGQARQGAYPTLGKNKHGHVL